MICQFIQIRYKNISIRHDDTLHALWVSIPPFWLKLTISDYFWLRYHKKLFTLNLFSIRYHGISNLSQLHIYFFHTILCKCLKFHIYTPKIKEYTPINQIIQNIFSHLNLSCLSICPHFKLILWQTQFLSSCGQKSSQIAKSAFIFATVINKEVRKVETARKVNYKEWWDNGDPPAVRLVRKKGDWHILPEKG